MEFSYETGSYVSPKIGEAAGRRDLKRSGKASPDILQIEADNAMSQ